MRKLMFIALLFILPSTLLAKEVGKITAIQGLVEILRDGKPPAIEAKIDMQINEKDAIRTKSDSRAEITLLDGTVIKIAPRSRVDISEYLFDEKVVKATLGLPRGKVGAYVAKETTEKISLDPKANRFEIKTPVAVAGVRGTVPIVTHRANVTTVLVVTGRLYVFNPRIPERVAELVAGQVTTVREGQAPSPPRTVSPREIEREVRDITVPRREEQRRGELREPSPAEPRIGARTFPVEAERREIFSVFERLEGEGETPSRTLAQTIGQAGFMVRTEEIRTFTPPLTEVQTQLTSPPPPPPPPPPEPEPQPPPPPPPPEPTPQPQPEPQPPPPPPPPQPEPTPPPQPEPTPPPQPEPGPQPEPQPPEPPPSGGGGGTVPSYSINVEFLSATPGSVGLNFRASSSDQRAIRVQYRVCTYQDCGTWNYGNQGYENSPTITVPVQASTQTGYRIEFKAQDSSGIPSANTATYPSSSDYIYALFQQFSGDINGTSAIGKVSTIRGNISDADKGKGVYVITPSQHIGFTQSIAAGGGNISSNFWSLSASGGTGQGSTATYSNSRFTLITPQSVYRSSGSISATLSDGNINQIESQPSVREYPLGFSSKIDAAFHDYDSTEKKVYAIQDPNSAKFLLGITSDFTYPDSGTVSTSSSAVGVVSHNQGIWWGDWTRNDQSSNAEIKGFAAGYMKDSSNFDYMMYGLYSDFARKNLGLVSGNKGTGTNLFLDSVKVLDIEPQLTFKKVSGAFDQPVTNFWTNRIQGSYTGFFTSNQDNLAIGPTVIFTTSQGKISSATISPRHGSDGPIEPWGVFGIELGGTYSSQNPPTGLVLEFSGTHWDNRDGSQGTPDYWIGLVQDSQINNGLMSGTFLGKFMTPTHYGTMSGRMLGEMESDRWVGVILGEYGTDKLVELGSNVHLSGAKIYRNDLDDDLKDYTGTQSAEIVAYLGSDSSSQRLYSVGKIDPPENIVLQPGSSQSPGPGYVWVSPLADEMSEAYKVYAAGRIAPYEEGSEMRYAIDGNIFGILKNSGSYNGLFKGNITSLNSGHGVLTLEKAFSMEGTISGSAVFSSHSQITSEMSSTDVELVESGSVQGIQNKTVRAFLDSGNFGIGSIALGGTYSSVPQGEWYFAFRGAFGNDFTMEAISTGNIWGHENYILKNVIKGSTYGCYYDLAPSSPVTGIFIGETVGTFNPTGQKWQTATVGVFLETNTFLNNLSTLGSIGVPTVEVGNASFKYENENCSNNCFDSVQMNEVKFFSTATQQKPLIWATSNVQGSFKGTPAETSIQLSAISGASGNINFEITRWGSSTWAGKVYTDSAYPINLSGGSYSGEVHMRGVAAGTINDSSFSGTAAGYVK
ncbi:MAG: FecR family protein [Candidatus Bathyarchaeia archaeon]